MQETEINWTELSWNPVSGCTKISAGCKHCYAHGLAEQKRGTVAFPNGFDLTLRPHKLSEPRRLKQPSLIFVNSMSDPFHEGIPDDYRDEIFEAIRRSPQHRYQMLTKRPENAEHYLAHHDLPDCVWLGVTVEHADTLGRLDVLRKLKARVRFVSIEPMLGPMPNIDLSGIHWVIVGGESGRHLLREDECSKRGLVRLGGKGEPRWVAREDRKDWVRQIRDACTRQSVPFHFKQWGGSKGSLAGRVLDGRTWEEKPAVIGAMPGTELPSQTVQLRLVG
jgi:protein gp37